MPLNKHLYVVAFDIVSDKIRYRCVKILLSYGQRVQKSVFECILNDKQFLEMKSKLVYYTNLHQTPDSSFFLQYPVRQMDLHNNRLLLLLS